ncbi:MAG: sigma-70 family RNA polymerase sigma factor [Clostridia bacterium]|nr:sigma-70 family RNA polymerase sigma factor [Clostridia bacterium]
MHHSIESNLNECLAAAKRGDQAAFEALLARYAPLIDSQIPTYAPPADADDLRQEACIAFCRAVERFDMEQADVQFGLYAKICIRNHLISCLRRMHVGEPVLSLEDEKNDPSAGTDPAQSIVEEESYAALYRRVEALLSPYENRVWWLYLSGHTAREIAELFSKDERSVQNAIYRIRKKLRASLP